MKILFFLCSLLLLVDAKDIGSWLRDGNASGNLKYYFIETNKNYISGLQTSAHSNALGAQLSYQSSNLHGFSLAATFMTTHGFALPDNVESSTIGQDEGKRGEDPSQGYSVLGEVYLEYKDKNKNFWFGRRAIKTPMVGSKEARMLPSTIEGMQATLTFNENTKLSLYSIDKFKQRSSKRFTNTVKHALGDDTYAVIGRDESSLYALGVEYKENALALSLYDFYAKDFLHTLYADMVYKKDFYSLSAQVVTQSSVGNADRNLAQVSSITKGKKIDASAVGVNAKLYHKESSFDLVYRKIFRNPDRYDSIITPWDGTLLYAYSSTTNNLGQSLYGNGLTAGGAYVGGTQGFKFGYTQKYAFLRLKGFKTHIAYAVYKNPLYREDQEDLKAILFYDMGAFSLQLKGIWIDNDTYTFKDGSVNQLDSLTQYHAILNYKF